PGTAAAANIEAGEDPLRPGERRRARRAVGRERVAGTGAWPRPLLRGCVPAAVVQGKRKEEYTKMSPEVALNRISPALSPFISSVVRNGKVGLDATNCLRITDLKSGQYQSHQTLAYIYIYEQDLRDRVLFVVVLQPLLMQSKKEICTSLTPGPSCDRFKLHIPYAGETLKWDIIFNAHYPDLPPDFIFGEDAEFLPDPSALHNLASWNPSNPECLLLVVKELVQQYHQFQCSRLRESSRLMFEYQTLLEEPQYGENMEIYAGKKNNWTPGLISVTFFPQTGEFSARFLLKLPVDFSNIPTYLLKENGIDRFMPVITKRYHSYQKDVNEDPGEDVALLSVSFEDAEATQVFPKLYLSPRIEHKIAKDRLLNLPPMLRGDSCGLLFCVGGLYGDASVVAALWKTVTWNVDFTIEAFNHNSSIDCEQIFTRMHLHALVVKKEDYEHYISSPEAVVKKPFVDLTTVVLTNYLPNGMKFPLVVLIHALGGSSALHIPAFPGGGCLIDYVPQVCQLLTNKVQYVIQGYHKRREYIAAFLSHFGTGVVEYDAEGFTKLTLLLMWKDFCFLVHIDLPLYFPRDQPTLTFQSVYHFTNSGQLYSQAQKNYPYSPRWDGNEMAKRAKAYFKTFVPQFQEAAFANGKL
ncbi:Bre, partial [Columba livia]